MGYSSYLCKHCDHGIVDASATDEGINEWMAHVVMMTSDGSRMVEPKYGGYEGHYERFAMGNDPVWVHHACWELAGKPEHDAYDGPSKGDPNQGGGSHRGSLDIIDPRITDPEERARLLEEGIERRRQKRFDRNARSVRDWMEEAEEEYYIEKHNGELFRFRWSYFETYPHDDEGKFVKGSEMDGTWWHMSDELDNEWADEERLFRGTEDELKAQLSARWAAFLESDEHKTYVERAKEMTRQHDAEKIEELKTEGRFRPTYGPRKIDGEEKWPVYFVMDELYASGDDLREECWHGKGRKTRAQEKADRLNAEWAAAGYPNPRDDA